MYSHFCINNNFKIQLQVISPYCLLNCQIVVKVSTSSIRDAHAFVGIFLILRLNLNSNCNVWLSPSQKFSAVICETLSDASPKVTCPKLAPSGSDSFYKCILFCFKIRNVCVCAQSCLTLCDPMGCSPLGSADHRIFQARILEWVAISSSRESSWPRDQTLVSCTAGKFIACSYYGSPWLRIYPFKLVFVFFG